MSSFFFMISVFWCKINKKRHRLHRFSQIICIFAQNYQQSMQELELKSTIQVCQPDELMPEEQHLLQLAIEATDRSYAPYSEFHVGAAVRLGNGVELTGSNQENAAFPSGLCAERTALFYAGSQYPDVPVCMLAIAARGTDGELTEEPTGPCGACRQVIIESETRAGKPIRILLYGKKHVFVIDGIRPLMPLIFSEF
jgi:cytidine deaminase